MSLPAIGWASPYQLGHGIFIDDALLIGYLLVLFTTGQSQKLISTSSAHLYAGLVALLAALGMISAGVNAYRLFDIGQAGRLLLLSMYVLCVVYWVRSRGPQFALRSYLLGIAAGG